MPSLCGLLDSRFRRVPVVLSESADQISTIKFRINGHPDGTLVLTTSENGSYVSKDNGDTWQFKFRQTRPTVTDPMVPIFGPTSDEWLSGTSYNLAGTLDGGTTMIPLGTAGGGNAILFGGAYNQHTGRYMIVWSARASTLGRDMVVANATDTTSVGTPINNTRIWIPERNRLLYGSATGYRWSDDGGLTYTGSAALVYSSVGQAARIDANTIGLWSTTTMTAYRLQKISENNGDTWIDTPSDYLRLNGERPSPALCQQDNTFFIPSENGSVLFKRKGEPGLLGFGASSLGGAPDGALAYSQPQQMFSNGKYLFVVFKDKILVRAKAKYP